MEQPTVVKYSRRLKRISLERYLVSKIIYEPEKVTFHDLFALYDNLIWLERKSQSDADFRRKFGKSLEVLSMFLKEVNLGSGFSVKALLKLSNKFRTGLEGFFLPVRNYPEYKSRFSGLFSVRALKQPQDANKHLPPKRIIGVGYRDKGTARDPAKDGSPSWQEVACRSGQLALTINRIKEARNFGELERAFKDFFGKEHFQ